jgi:hypothetical protein
MSLNKNNILIGKTLKEVRELYPTTEVRVTKVGNAHSRVTYDHRFGRLNVELSDDGIVVSARFG